MPYRLTILLLLAAAGLAACGNPYEHSYHDLAGGWKSAVFLPPTTAPRLVHASDHPQQDLLSLYEQGYDVMGYSDFSGNPESEELALSQAKKIGAEVVLVSTKVLDTQTTVVPLFTGSSTIYVPDSYSTFEQSALYFGPTIGTGLGVLFGKPTPDQEREAGTSKFVPVVAVRQGSPADKGGITRGDLLLSVAGLPVYDERTMVTAMRIASAETSAFVLLRGGQRITTTFRIPPSW
jgi:hypothetical protein